MILNDMEKKIRIKDQRGPLVVKFCCYGQKQVLNIYTFNTVYEGDEN